MLRPDLERLPPRLMRLPIARGYPVPWFVAQIDGVYDFRVVDSDKFALAVKRRLCWVCGQPLGLWLAFGIGPMCSITRTISEPPSHRECMEWSTRHCPFLAEPTFTRNLHNLPEGAAAPAGIALVRNPGVVCLWITRSYELFRVPGDTQHQPLITIGEPTHVSWWREGRPATRAEVEASIGGGLPTLLAAAREDGPFAIAILGKQYEAAQAFWPAAETVTP